MDVEETEPKEEKSVPAIAKSDSDGDCAAKPDRNLYRDQTGAFQFEKFRSNLFDLLIQQKKLNKRVKSLTNDVKDLEAKNSSQADLANTKITELKECISQLELDIKGTASECEFRLQAANERVQEAERSKQAAALLAKEQNNRLQEQQVEINTLKSSLEQSIEEPAVSSAEKMRVVLSLKQSYSNLRKTMEELQTRLDQTDAHITEARATMEMYERTFCSLKQTIGQLEKERDLLEKTVEKHETMHKQCDDNMASANAELVASKEEHQLLQKQLDLLREALKREQEQFSNQSATLAQLQQLVLSSSSTIEEQEKVISTQRDEMIALRLKLEAVENALELKTAEQRAAQRQMTEMEAHLQLQKEEIKTEDQSTQTERGELEESAMEPILLQSPAKPQPPPPVEIQPPHVEVQPQPEIPAVEPPTVEEAPAVEPPTVEEAPAVEPPTVEPPVVAPPTVEEAPAVAPPPQKEKAAPVAKRSKTCAACGEVPFGLMIPCKHCGSMFHASCTPSGRKLGSKRRFVCKSCRASRTQSLNR